MKFFAVYPLLWVPAVAFNTNFATRRKGDGSSHQPDTLRPLKRMKGELQSKSLKVEKSKKSKESKKSGGSKKSAKSKKSGESLSENNNAPKKRLCKECKAGALVCAEIRLSLFLSCCGRQNNKPSFPFVLPKISCK